MYKKIKFHPDDSSLFDYALGNLSEPESLIVTSHITYCSLCRSNTSNYEKVGGTFLDKDTGIDVSKNLLESIFERIESEKDIPRSPQNYSAILKTSLKEEGLQIPSSIANYLENKNDTSNWNSTINNVKYFDFKFSSSEYKARLLEISPGKVLPKHGHNGLETTLVLYGGYHDENGSYNIGDIVTASDKDIHKPVSSIDDGCLCLIVSSGSIKFKGLLGSILNLSRF